MEKQYDYRYLNLFSGIFCAVIALNLISIFTIANPYMALVCAVIQGVLYVGVLEALHQATHGNLFTARWANRAVGMVLGALLFMPYTRYKFFHAYHHAYTATDLDPEKALYVSPMKGAFAPFILAPWGQVGFSSLVLKTNKYLKERYSSEDAVSIAFVFLCLGAFLACLAVDPWRAVCAFLIPFCVFAWADYLFNQAEHYNIPILESERPEQATSSNDLLLPRWLSVIFLNRNLHRVHHCFPKTPWYSAPAKFRQMQQEGVGLASQTLSFGEFCKNYFNNGPRHWGVR